MKKLMSLMLGLTLILGTSAFAADEKAGDKGKVAEKKGKKKAARKADEKKEEKK